MKHPKSKNTNSIKGFSLIELLIAMTVTLVLMGIASTLFSGALGTKKRESRKTDALTSAQAALNIMSREIANSGYGLEGNGIVLSESNSSRIRVRANLVNTNLIINDAGEDVTYFFDNATDSIVRYDLNAVNPKTSVVINKISEVNFCYYTYTGTNSNPVGCGVAPTADTGRVRITVTVRLEEVQGQPKNQTVKLTSDVTLRNSQYMLNQY